MTTTASPGLVPKALRFELRLATRHLRAGGGQTLLTISAVAVGVIIVIFITALIFGLRQKLTTLLIEAIPHIIIQVEEAKPIPWADIPGTPAGVHSSRVERQAPQQKHIDNWAQVADTVRRLPQVYLVAPVVKEQGSASRGGNPVGVTVVGADPALQDDVAPVSKHLIAGRYRGLSSDEIVIDVKLADELGVTTGDRLRLTLSTGTADTFTIVGVYSRGQGRGDAYVTLRTAQRLCGLGTSVNTMFVKLRDVFAADQVADQIMALLPYKAKSWSREFPSFLTSLKMQAAVAYLTSVLSLMASSFAIASVLIVSVLQKSKQIGILKSMGARRRQILTVFILEGLGVALVGSVLGAVLGIAIVYFLSLIKQPVTQVGDMPEQLFPVAVLPVYIVLAMGAAIVATVMAAWLPARRAASLNPVEVIR
jgi:lipoprotein-releasing system permease protein